MKPATRELGKWSIEAAESQECGLVFVPPTGLEIPIGMYILNPSLQNVKPKDNFRPDFEISFS